MKNILSIVFLVFISSVAYSYKNIPIQYLKLPYGITPEEANKILVDTKLISTEATVLTGTIYSHNYADPELTWYNPTELRWYNISFTTNTADALFKRDNIAYLAYSNSEIFKCIVINKDSISQDNTSIIAGNQTKWVYRIYFLNDALFAISARYENENEVEDYKQKNMNVRNAHPGYIVPPILFEESLQKLQDAYGGFKFRRTKTLDFFSNQNYGAWTYPLANLFMSVYHINYYKGSANFTISYIDNYRFLPIAAKFQNRKYDPNIISSDIQADIK